MQKSNCILILNLIKFIFTKIYKWKPFLPAHASEQGNVIGSVRIPESAVALSM